MYEDVEVGNFFVYKDRVQSIQREVCEGGFQLEKDVGEE